MCLPLLCRHLPMIGIVDTAGSLVEESLEVL